MEAHSVDVPYTLLVMLFCLNTGILLYTFFSYARFLRRRIPQLGRCLVLVLISALSGVLSFACLVLPVGPAMEVLVSINVVAGYFINVLLVQVVLCIMGYNRPKELLAQRFLLIIPAAGVVLAVLDPVLGTFVAEVSRLEGERGYLIQMKPLGFGLAAVSSALIALMFLLAVVALARRKGRFMDHRVILALIASVVVPSAAKYLEMLLEPVTGTNYRLATFAAWIPVVVICYVYFGYLRSARILAMDRADEVFVVFDKWGSVVDLNRAGRDFFSQYGAGARADREAFHRLLGAAGPEDLRAGEFSLEREDGVHFFHSTEFKISDGLSQYCGDGYILREVTEYHQRLDALNTLAIEDALTGAKNRRYFFDAAPSVLRRAAKAGSPVTLLMIDLDHFKRVNDTHGHSVGDEVLRHLTAACSAKLRKTDILFRYGGEEFVVLCEDTGRDQGRQMAHRLREAVAEAPAPTTAGPIPVTISVGGCSFYPAKGDSIQHWVDVADEHLYLAKDAGRNRVAYHTA